MKPNALLSSIFFTIFLPTLSALHSNKTFLASRPEGLHLPIEDAVSHRTLRMQSLKSSGRNIEVTGIFGESQNRNSLSQYFLFGGKDRLLVGKGVDIDNQHLKFDETSPCNLTGEIALAPHTELYGLRFDYFQYLDQFAKHLFVHGSTQVTNVQHDPNFAVARSIPSTDGGKSIEDYFAGKVMLSACDGETVRELQEPLFFGQFKGTHDRTGTADIFIELGYDFSARESVLLRGRGFLIVPTCDSDTSEFVFAPRLGTGGHWGIGARLDGALTLWQHKKNEYPLYKKSTLELVYDGRIIYLFPANERRILGLKDCCGNELCFGQYTLFGKVGCPQVLPAANVLSQRVRVEPDWQFEGLIMLAHSISEYTINLGYNAYITDAEKVSRRDTWDDKSFGFVGKEFADEIGCFAHFSDEIRAKSNFSLSRTNCTNTIGKLDCSGMTKQERGFVQASQLSTAAAATPALFTNAIFLGVGRHFDRTRYTTTASAGFLYEWSTNNAALEQFMVWLKFGIFFR